MAFKIYTKTGDKGATALIGGSKISKAHLRIEAYGTVDELNSYIGLCRDLTEQENIQAELQKIQEQLFIVGAILACDPDKHIKMQIPEMKEAYITALESGIDSMDAVLPPMKFFILPGGHPLVSHFHIGRSICRRAERCCVRLHEVSAVAPLVLTFLNRLSDYLFTLARYTAHLKSIDDIPWQPDDL
ncbi:MAG: cob(I)yrinic acid a,c-diamide adenosyltransferase [Chitinophagaceae bacterium]|nr:cob(I)yrinic acid a,c-diamide adenosyltransferase [Chitinophagaceae bacterium]